MTNQKIEVKVIFTDLDGWDLPLTDGELMEVELTKLTKDIKAAICSDSFVNWNSVEVSSKMV